MATLGLSPIRWRRGGPCGCLSGSSVAGPSVRRRSSGCDLADPRSRRSCTGPRRRSDLQLSPTGRDPVSRSSRDALGRTAYVRVRVRPVDASRWRAAAADAAVDRWAVLFEHRTVVPVPLRHGTLPILGYRIGGFAYLTDCSEIPDRSWACLADLEVLVVDALRRRSHSTHFNLDQAIEAADRIAARQTLFTHMSHDLGHAATCATLPPGMALAHDGLEVSVGEVTPESAVRAVTGSAES